MKISYAGRLKAHLRDYRRQKWPGAPAGTWKGQSYEHILSAEQAQENVIETIRVEFWHGNDAPKLHLYFAHLNSSQALAFNLFFPFFRAQSGNSNNTLVEFLGLSGEKILDGKFEAVLDAAEGTNFDFWLHFESGNEVVIEVKLSENEFGTATPNVARLQKWATIYRPRLKNVVRPSLLADSDEARSDFFAHYQLLRNLSYARAEPRRVVVLLYPRQNEKLEGTRLWLQENLLLQAAPLVKIVYLEDFVEDILVQTRDATRKDSFLQEHFTLVKEKYLPEK